MKVAVVIPCFRVKKHILHVLSKIGEEVSAIYVIDDFCPENSGDCVRMNSNDHRVTVIKHKKNEGVGGAVLTGYKSAIAAGADIIVKIDGDGQMDPSLIKQFISPIAEGAADYTKGNRFYDLKEINRMPKHRLFANSVLSLVNKFSSGYWNIFDPTNGYTAIHAEIVHLLPSEKISKRYFFESDMLFHLGLLNAVVFDIPMHSVYNEEKSNIKAMPTFVDFFYGHISNFTKRIFYKYFLRDMSAATFELLFGVILLLFGSFSGVIFWINSIRSQFAATPGKVMIAALPILIGINLIIAFISYDVGSVPNYPRHKKIFKL